MFELRSTQKSIIPHRSTPNCSTTRHLLQLRGGVVRRAEAGRGRVHLRQRRRLQGRLRQQREARGRLPRQEGRGEEDRGLEAGEAHLLRARRREEEVNGVIEKNVSRERERERIWLSVFSDSWLCCMYALIRYGT